MLDLKDIEDALIIDIKANIPGMKTVATHEKEFNTFLPEALRTYAPFILIHYDGTHPKVGEHHADDSSGVCERGFNLTIGTESLRSKKESQRGAYEILDQLRNRYNGYVMTIGDESITIVYDGDDFLFTSNSLTAYSLYLKWTEN